jgi:hypothetical protein
LFSSVTPFLLGEPTAGANRKTSRGLAFCFAKLAYTETNRDDLKLLLDAEREDVVLSLFNRRLSRTDHQVT